MSQQLSGEQLKKNFKLSVYVRIGIVYFKSSPCVYLGLNLFLEDMSMNNEISKEIQNYQHT